MDGGGPGPYEENFPGARYGAESWTEGSGNLWLFGGISQNYVNPSIPFYDDLWVFDPSTNDWTNIYSPPNPRPDPCPSGNIPPVGGPPRRPGPTIAATCGSLAALSGSRCPATSATTFGSSIPPPGYGRLWAEAVRRARIARPECTARWGSLQRETYQEAGILLRAGLTAAAISGFLGAVAILAATSAP